MTSLPMQRPICQVPGHGTMSIRSDHRQTYIQKWCGVWYDCQRCSNSVLFPSLAVQKIHSMNLINPNTLVFVSDH
jgi:hypothetical protein